MFTYAMIHEKGEREYQEDSVAAYLGETVSSFWVADGLGGHGGGKEASRIIIENCGKGTGKDFNLEKCFWNAFAAGNQILLKEQDRIQDTRGMKTTLVGCILKGKELTWAHIGDSRMYLFWKGKIITRTLDHSVPQMLVLGGQIQEKDIRRHPDRNRVLRVLGMRDEEINYDVGRTVLTEQGMAVLLCTDGFWEWILESAMENYLAESDTVEQWMLLMKDHVLECGKGSNMDNLTALGIWFL